VAARLRTERIAHALKTSTRKHKPSGTRRKLYKFLK
jgi:hypothetical protein